METNKNTKQTDIARVYFNPKHTTGFTGRAELKSVSEYKIHVSSGNVGKWQQQTYSYTIHKSARKKLKRKSCILTGNIKRSSNFFFNLKNTMI